MTTSNDEAFARLAQPDAPLHPPTYHPPAHREERVHGEPDGKHNSYWRLLLLIAVICLAIGGAIFGAYMNSGTEDSLLYAGEPRDGALLGWSIFFGGLGQVVLIPGLIGWGIDASGLTRGR